MSWCDKLASTPSIGFKLEPYYTSGDSIIDALRPILDRLVDGDRMLFTVDRHESFAFSFTTEDGFQHGIEPLKAFVNFHHRLKAKAISGGPPIMEMLSKPLPYTELLQEVAKRLIEMTLLVPGAKQRKIARIGIVSATKVAEDEVPPGIARFIHYIGRPWKGSIDSFGVQIAGKIGDASGWSDRCIHSLAKREEDTDGLLTLQFDWQRKFKSARPITSDSLKETISKAQQSALEYFERLAEGGQFDEELIRATT